MKISLSIILLIIIISFFIYIKKKESFYLENIDVSNEINILKGEILYLNSKITEIQALIFKGQISE